MKYIENHYFINYNYLKLLIDINTITLLTNRAYTKGWFTNKCTIVGANGIITLSVPLLGGRNQKSLLKGVKIAYEEDWRKQHLRSIKSCYGNAPYFDYYYPIFQKIYSQKFELLFDLNLFILKELLLILKVDINIDINDNLITIEDTLFTKSDVLKNSTLYSTKINYTQVFEDRLGFTSNLSIIDLIMCMGPQSKGILEL
jgi:hypothetical protein